MNKVDVVREVAKRTGLTQREVKKVLDGTVDLIAEQLSKGQSVDIVGFGRFTLKAWRGRANYDVRSGMKIWKPPTEYPAFKMADAFKNRIRAGLASNPRG